MKSFEPFAHSDKQEVISQREHLEFIQQQIAVELEAAGIIETGWQTLSYRHYLEEERNRERGIAQPKATQEYADPNSQLTKAILFVTYPANRESFVQQLVWLQLSTPRLQDDGSITKNTEKVLMGRVQAGTVLVPEHYYGEEHLKLAADKVTGLQECRLLGTLRNLAPDLSTIIDP